MAEDRIWNLIAKKLSCEASEAELRDLEMLLRENPDLHYPVQTIIDLWMSDVQFDQQEAHEAFTRHIERMKELKIDYRNQQEEESVNKKALINKKLFLGPVLAVVITGALFLGIRFLGTGIPASLHVTPDAEKYVSQISTKNGSKTNLILPDGTKVWLNAGSSHQV